MRKMNQERRRLLLEREQELEQATGGKEHGSVFCARLFVMGAWREIAHRASAPPDPRRGRNGCSRPYNSGLPHQSGFEIVSGPPAYSGYPANGRPPRRRDHVPARAPMPNRNVLRCTALETGPPGPATFGFPAPERVRACRRMQWSRHFAAS